jgi:hypothetical protein
LSFRFYEPESLPEPYDVVWCRIPFDSGPEFHPCLVLESLVDSEGRPHVLLVPGTSNASKKGKEYYPLDVEVGCKCGLAKNTLFNLEAVGRFPWAAEFFHWQGGKPKPRPLPGAAVKEFQVHAAHYQNETGWDPFGT